LETGLSLPLQLKKESLRQVLNHPSTLHRLGAFAALLENLTPAQFAALYADLSTIDSGRDYEVRTFFFRRWTLVAPEAALAAAMKEDKYWVVFAAWAERDPEAALAQFDKTTSITGFSAIALRDRMRALAMPKPGQLPPATAMKRIRELQGEGGATPAVLNAMAEIVRDWANTDPQAAWREALALPAEGNAKDVRAWAMTVLVYKMAAADPEGVLQWINALPEPERQAMQPEYVDGLASAGKTSQAREYAMAMAEGPARQKAMAGIANALYGKDAEAAKAFITRLPDSDWQDPSVFSGVFERWLSADPARATEVLLKRFPANPSVGPAQQRAYAHMFFFWSNRADPKGVGEFFLKLPESVGGSELTKLASVFTATDPAGAAEWVTSLPNSARRDNLLTQIANEWAGAKVPEVATWIDKLPQGSGKSAAIEGFAKAIISTNPDDALAWLHSVPDEGERIERLSRVWRNWTDREMATKWAETCPLLSEAERRALRTIE
jgi:hypothetical protein